MTVFLHPPADVTFEGEVSEEDRRRISLAIGAGVRRALSNAAAGSRTRAGQRVAGEVSEPLDISRVDHDRGLYQVPSYKDEGRATTAQLLETLAPEMAPGVVAYSEPSPVEGALIAHMPGNRYVNVRSARYASAGTLTEAIIVGERLFATGSFAIVQGPLGTKTMRYLAAATDPSVADADLGEKAGSEVPPELQGVPGELVREGVRRVLGEEVLGSLVSKDGEYLIRGLLTSDRKPHWRNAALASLWFAQLAQEQQRGITGPDPEVARIIIFDDIDAMVDEIEAGHTGQLQQAAEMLSKFDAETFALVGWETKVRYLKVLLAAWTWAEEEKAVVEIFKSLKDTTEFNAVVAMLKTADRYDQLFNDLDSELYDLLVVVGQKFARDRGPFTLRQLFELVDSMGLITEAMRLANPLGPGGSLISSPQRLIDEAHEAAASLLRFVTDAVEALVMLFTETGKIFDGIVALAKLLAEIELAQWGYPPAVEHMAELLAQQGRRVLEGMRGADALGAGEKVVRRLKWRLIWEIASLFIGVGEIKAAIAGAELGQKLAGVVRFLAVLLKLGEAVEEEADAARVARLAALLKAERTAFASTEEAAELLSHLPEDDIRKLGRLLKVHDVQEGETLAQLAARATDLHQAVEDAIAKTELLKALATKSGGLSEDTVRAFATLVGRDGTEVRSAARVVAAIPEGEGARFAATLERIPLSQLPAASRAPVLELVAGSTKRMDAVAHLGYDSFYAVARRAAGRTEDIEHYLDTLEQIEQRLAGEGRQADYRRLLDRLEQNEAGAWQELDDAHQARLGPAAKPHPLDWPALEARVEFGPPRQTAGGFMSRSAREGDRGVVYVEGKVSEQLPQRETMAGYTPTLPEEHATHIVGMQLGENLPEGIVSGPGAPYNLGPLKQVENLSRDVYERAIRLGADVETSALVRIEYRLVDGTEVPVVVGVQRRAWVRPPGTEGLPPGTDFPEFFVDLEAEVDPVTRAVNVTRNNVERPGRSIGYDPRTPIVRRDKL